MRVIVGDTGLIGRNLMSQAEFNLSFNSSNIINFCDMVKNNDELYLSCLPATKWQVNLNTNSKFFDMLNAINIFNILKTHSYSKIVLISTIDVYDHTELGSAENEEVITETMSYGQNRLRFEKMITSSLDYESIKIVRLPAVFGPNLKKNLLFDLLNNNQTDKINLNSSYQWYNLNNLFRDIENFKNNDVPILNLFSEPVSTQEIVNIFNKDVGFYGNHIKYDYRTIHNSSGYYVDREIILNDIKDFINAYGS